MRFRSIVCALTGVLGLLSPAIASPTPAKFQALSQLNIPRTSLTERALADLNLCVSLEVKINLTDLLNGIKIDVEAQTPPSGGGLIGGLIGGVINAVGGVVDGLVGTLTQILADLTRFIGLNLEVDLGTLCLCLDAGVLTPGSLAQVTAIAGPQFNSGVLGEVAKLIPGIVDLVVLLVAPIIETKAAEAPVCPSFPAEAIPLPDGATCGSSCLFACPTGLKPCDRRCIAESATCCPLDQKDCGNGQCVAVDNMCPSAAMTVQRRSVKERSRYACRQPLSACPVSHLLARDGSSVAGAGFECLDTLANIESCGGCISPFKGNVAGQDCTAIANADDVACAGGTCIVGSCVAGFVPSADGSACVNSSSGARRPLKSRKSRN